MNKRNKLIATTIALFSICTSGAMAAVTQTDYIKDSGSDTIMVKGISNGREQVSVHIVKDGEISDSTIVEKTVYANQTTAGEDGSFSFVAKVHDSGKYNIFVSSEDLSVDSVKIPVDFYNSTDYAAVIAQLNQDLAGQTDDAFCNTVIANTVKLGFDDQINQIIDIRDVAKIMYQGLKNKTLSADEYIKNQDYYKNCAMMVAANHGKLTGIYSYASNIIDGNELLKKYWNQYIITAEAENYAVGKLCNKNLSNVNELEKNISEILLLTATRYPNGYMSLKDLYSDFKNILGISDITSSSKVYSALAGNDYADIKALVEAYKSALKNSQSSGGSSGGGGGAGGGSGSSGSKISMSASTIQEISGMGAQERYAQEIPLKFIDLGSVRWAYPSISVLFDKGIISGVSETEFAPERNVKREEFTKMLVTAMGKEVSIYDGVFTDVKNDAWYAGYVARAYADGLVSGISDTEFGVSQNITRQDMAVMIYRAMQYKGYQKVNSTVEFADKDSIAEYATEAIAELSNVGIISGVGDNMFAPQKTATRAEAAVIIERALKYLQ